MAAEQNVGAGPVRAAHVFDVSRLQSYFAAHVPAINVGDLRRTEDNRWLAVRPNLCPSRCPKQDCGKSGNNSFNVQF